MFTYRSTSLYLLLAAFIILPLISQAAGSTTSATTTASSTTPLASSTITVTATTTSTLPRRTEGIIALSPLAQTRIKNLTANLSNREDAAVRRLENVSARLESRISLLSTSGKNVDAARQHLLDANTSLAQAKLALATIDKSVETFIGSATPRESWASLKLTYTTINTNLQVSLTALRATLAALETAPPISTSTSASTSSSTAPAL